VESLIVDRSSVQSMRDAFGIREFDIVYDQVCNTGEEAGIAKEVFRGKIGKLVFTSTASVYSAAPDRYESFFDPRTFEPSGISENTYQHGKKSAEKVYLDADFPVIAVRIPVVVGPDDYIIDRRAVPPLFLVFSWHRLRV
jgi:nucleoside-diphosphate-sugar epimerase